MNTNTNTTAPTETETQTYTPTHTWHRTRDCYAVAEPYGKGGPLFEVGRDKTPNTFGFYVNDVLECALYNCHSLDEAIERAERRAQWVESLFEVAPWN